MARPTPSRLRRWQGPRSGLRWWQGPRSGPRSRLRWWQVPRSAAQRAMHGNARAVHVCMCFAHVQFHCSPCSPAPLTVAFISKRVACPPHGIHLRNIAQM
eukprot:366036-Chlamydomonas_euryale.AAC.18